MKKLILIIFFFIISQNVSFCENFTTDNLVTYSTNNKYFGLKDKNDNIIIEEQYKKLIRLGKNSWIIQNKKNKFGLIDCSGNFLIQPKYNHAERYFNKFVKFGNTKDYGLYNDKGEIVIPPEYSKILPLFGQKFLTCKNFKYGIYSESGEKLLDNVCDYIYMPNPDKICISYDNTFYTFKADKENANISFIQHEEELKLSRPDKDIPLYLKTGVNAGYSIVSATDYTFKAFSAISNAYEETIDDLMFSQGIDTISIFMNMSWLPKFPFCFAKNYWIFLQSPSEGILNDVKNELKEQIK